MSVDLGTVDSDQERRNRRRNRKKRNGESPYSGKGELNQYNEDDFRFQFCFISSC